MEEIILIKTEAFSITQMEFLLRMLVATGIGFVLGLEREYARMQKEGLGEVFAGVRTFVVVVLVGFLSTFLSFLLHPLIVLGGFASVVVLVGISYFVQSRNGDVGGTTEFAIILAYLLGASTLMGYIEISLALMVVTLVILSLKVRLHQFIGEISEEELFAFVTFVVVALLVLPFLPDQTFGPYDVLNPREIGWVIVLTSGIGFIGYMMMKFFGSGKGILLTGILGGLVSSTVVTWVFSKKSKNVPALSRNCAIAILAASSIMVIRVFVWIVIFNKNLLWGLILPLSIVLLAGIGIAWYLYRKEGQQTLPETIPLGNPLNLKDAIFFGVLYAGILLLINYANQTFGTRGIFLSSAVAALTDIDAITISISKLAEETISANIAQNAILLSTLSNTIIKIGIALWFGSVSLRKDILVGYGMIFLAGLIGFGILNF